MSGIMSGRNNEEKHPQQIEEKGHGWPSPDGALWGRMAIRNFEQWPDLDTLGRRMNPIGSGSCSLCRQKSLPSSKRETLSL